MQCFNIDLIPERDFPLKKDRSALFHHAPHTQTFVKIRTFWFLNTLLEQTFASKP